VGTEEGIVYEFSKYYHNKILTTFHAHSMPVYAIKWNYYLKRVFITCSSDWTVKIWDHDYK
jgi:dynein intermediate chain 1